MTYLVRVGKTGKSGKKKWSGKSQGIVRDFLFEGKGKIFKGAGKSQGNFSTPHFIQHRC